MKTKTNFLKYLRIVLTLCLITAVVGALLALVNGLTKDKIAENAQEAMNQAVAAIFGTCEASELSGDYDGPVTGVYRVTAGGEALGFCVYVTPNGYGGAVELMVGLTPEGKVAGISVVSHGETPNIGTKVLEDPAYLGQYNGISAPVTFGEGIDAISGATRSSNAVRDGVNAALALAPALCEKGGNAS